MLHSAPHLQVDGAITMCSARVARRERATASFHSQLLLPTNWARTPRASRNPNAATFSFFRRPSVTAFFYATRHWADLSRFLFATEVYP